MPIRTRSTHRRPGRRGGRRRWGREIRVLLVDGHPATRLGVGVLLESMTGAEVVGEAADAGEALRLNEALRPDLAIVDPELGDVCRRLKSRPNAPRVLVFSALSSREAVAAASLAGADSYVHKETSPQRLAEAIRRTLDGERVWLLGPQEPPSETDLRARIEAARLTPKEKEILALLLRRFTNQEIAGRLHVSVNTVRTHVKNVMKEVGLENRRELHGAPEAA